MGCSGEIQQTNRIKEITVIGTNKTANSNSRDFKEKKFKSRKALLTWDDSDENDKEGSEDEDVAQLCFMTNDDDPKVCLKARVDCNKWILDSGCSRHMTGDRSLFSHITSKNGGLVTFGDNSNGKIIGKGKIGTGSISIDNVSLVDSLEFNLISISQLIDSGHKVQFEGEKCLISHASDGSTLIGKRDGNIYTLSFDASDYSREVCLSVQHNDIWLWHRRLGHVHMDLIKKLLSKDLVRGLPNLRFIKDRVCDACQYGKQSKTSFQAKNVVSTSRPLQLLHLDLFGPTRNASLGGKFYAFVIVDDFSRYTWILFLSRKDEAFETNFSLVKQL
ncbi:hypothetical protein RJ640_024847 [Escallonia rubra]|uniref:Integrase catalytic domain-containing protein n=1 Tax=Escallonia rubra TaxID=112253 RepID=A0AA88RAD9_9ASTE|nr:hypothetical protein RJ640_024847 [Escallonia rubra]